MPTTLFSLPREIRDQIYDYVLISPSGFIEPNLIPYSEKTTSSGHSVRFSLCTNPPTKRIRIRTHDGRQREYTSLSLMRTCRQIHGETKDIFWHKNTFYFRTFHLSKHSLGVVSTLKSMGQISSRLITSICINMGTGMIGSRLARIPYSRLGKVLQVLASRARYGAFRNLELFWGVEVFRYAASYGLNQPYDDLLNSLRQGSEACKYERVIRLPNFVDSLEGSFEKPILDIPKDLHFAFGGKLFMGDALVWENYHSITA